jgi:Lar family restriction alleviation protein
MTDPVPSKDVLPCPFCGSTDVTVEQGDTFRWRVAVCVCGVRGPDVRVQTMGEGNPKQWDAQGEIDALEAWNKRASPEPGALQRIIEAYDAYRSRGVAPALNQYANLVAAIEAARAAQPPTERANAVPDDIQFAMGLLGAAQPPRDGQ